MKRLTQGVSILVIGALLAPPLNAYALVGGGWGTATVRYYVNTNNQDVTPAAAIAALQVGASAWSTQADIPVTLTYSGQVSDTAVNSSDSRNVVIFRNATSPDGGSTIANTYLWSSGGVYQDSDIVFWDGARTFVTGTSGCTSGAAYIEDIATHEFGHLLGLNHSSVNSATMYPSYSACSTSFRILDADDIAGIEKVYENGLYVPDEPPVITIVSPTNGATVGTPTSLVGSAIDTPDGNISANIRWSSNVSGNLGTGASLSVTLPAGSHVITATITDSIGYTMARAHVVTVTATASAPTITTHPQNKSVVVGQTANFTVTAAGSGLSYQWYAKPSGSSTFSTISGATSASYTTPATVLTDSSKQFHCRVTNSAGNLTSNAATLTVTASASPCDVNTDGTTNISDVQLSANQAIGVSACTADINQDSACNVIDVQRIVNAALGGTCVSP